MKMLTLRILSKQTFLLIAEKALLTIFHKIPTCLLNLSWLLFWENLQPCLLNGAAWYRIIYFEIFETGAGHQILQRKSDFVITNFHKFYIRGWCIKFAKYYKFTFYVLTFEPMKMQTLSAPQNDCMNHIFVKDINISSHI